MDYFISVLDKYLGQFVCEDAGRYRGQCPQWIRNILIICGVEWNGKTGNGNQVIDTLVRDYGGIYGESKYGYRIASADNKYDKAGHCWIEVKKDGKWIRYEQNAKENAGATSANFGAGTVYCVTKTDKPVPSYFYNIRYAYSPSIDLVIEVNSKKPEPTPVPSNEMPEWFKKWADGLADYLKNSIKEN